MKAPGQKFFVNHGGARTSESEGVGSRFRPTIHHLESGFSENDSRPPSADPTKKYLGGCLSKIMQGISGILWAAWAGGVLFGAAGWAAEPPDQRPNVVVLVTDDQRPDTIAALGNPVIRTPNLDALVRAGSTFTRAVCANPICTPSRAEILTGCSGFRNGVLDFGGKIDPQLVAWATAMQRGGYRTCYVGKWHNNGRPSGYGYDDCRGLFAGGGGRWWTPRHDHHGRDVTGYRGWVFQTDDGRMFPERGVGLTPEIDARFADAAVEYLVEPHDRPFFLHVNFTAPHDPLLMPPGYQDLYDPETIPLPDNFLPQHPFDHGNLQGRDELLLPFPRTDRDVRADLAVYYAVISHLDQQVGRIIDALRQSGQWQRTILVFTSDHGLAVGSHGLRGKQSMYEHTIGVPLILCGPGVPADRRFAAQVYLRDLYPTICDLTAVPIPSSVTGKSFAPVLRGQAETIHPFVVGYFRNFQRMIRTERWKLIHYPHLGRYQLFDLLNDPGETRDLSGDPENGEILQELQAMLSRWQQEKGDPLALNPETPG
jgi:arylsulfatase A-like enzyme